MPQKYSEQHHWNAILSIAFLVCAVLTFMLLQERHGIASALFAASFFDLLIMGLGTFRVVRLLSYDKIFAFVRLWFMDADPNAVGSHVKPPSGIRRAVAELLECPWCTGIWASLAVVLLYFIHPLGHFLVWLLAVAAVGSFFQVVSKATGRLGAIE